MLYQRGHLARPLDAVLGSASRLSSLRVLAHAKEPLSGREVARRAGINHQAAALALKDLERAGVARRRAVPGSIQWVLDQEHFLVDEALVYLFGAEARHADEVVAAVKGALDRRADWVFVTGEAAKGRLALGAPLDLIVVCPVGRRRALNEALRALTAELRDRFGLEPNVATLTKAEAASRIEMLDAWQLLPTEGPPSVFSGRF
jgi:hypothetical protein